MKTTKEDAQRKRREESYYIEIGIAAIVITLLFS